MIWLRDRLLQILSKWLISWKMELAPVSDKCFIQWAMNRKHTVSCRNIARLMRQREVKVGIVSVIGQQC
jgi:hypothetical protein